MNTSTAPTAWVRSTFSGPEGGSNCVEWSPAHAHTHGVVPVRDSKVPHGPTLAFSPASWAALVAYARTSGA
ncbi:DUF397 domain-containing protein [Streptomyces sp. NPDC050509]|uniref:DUF397 domain-containing protein n=1 Tax=Streptomyces sp. NPDC050509 TaxID=3365620 RepID=UPI00379395EE